MIFGSQRDFSLFRLINRELLRNIIEQEVLYYKIITETSTNIYGEALEKDYYEPVKLNCLIIRGDQVTTQEDMGRDVTRAVSFAFLRDDLVDVDVVPEMGDIIVWSENYYEADTVRENQLFLGKDNNYSLTDYGSQFGSSVSLIVDCHYTRVEKTGITSLR